MAGTAKEEGLYVVVMQTTRKCVVSKGFES